MKETLEMALEALTNPSTTAVQHAVALIKKELAQPERDCVLAEREACAKLCDEKALYFQYDFIPPYDVADSCAEEIRARGKK